MGLHIIEKNTNPKSNSKLGLVLAGGAISGGAFKVGGIKALNDYLVNRKITDFDIYVGLSAGAFLAAPLAGGIPPEEMLMSLDGKSKHFSQLSPLQMYKPNLKEIISRPLKYIYGHMTYLPGIAYDLFSSAPQLKDKFFSNLKELFKNPSYSNYEALLTPLLKVAYSTRSIPQLGELIPSGLFSNRALEEYLRLNMKKNRMSNNYKVLKKMTGRSLYISAMCLDTAERVVFGPDEKNDVTISQSIQASTALPGFYKPARIKGVDYIDGGVRRTANIDIAIDKGADLIICYNPFRPFNNEVFLEYLREENKYITKDKRISDWGLGMVINQVFRTLFHSRLMNAIDAYEKDPSFKKDIILIQPKEDDSEFFNLNPLYFWNRAKAAQQGFNSVTQTVDEHFDRIAGILSKYNVEMTRDVVTMDKEKIAKSRNDDRVIMDVLESEQPKKRLRIVSGGKKKQ